MFTAEEDKTCFRNAKNFGSEREFAMPFVDAMGQEAFKLNKTRSVAPHDLAFYCDFGVNCCKFDNDQAEKRDFKLLSGVEKRRSSRVVSIKNDMNYTILGIQPNKDLSNLSVTRNGQTNFYIHLIKNKERVS